MIHDTKKKLQPKLMARLLRCGENIAELLEEDADIS
jgi:hypothetical protein